MPIDMKQSPVDQVIHYLPFDPTTQLPPWWTNLTQTGKDTYVESMLSQMEQDDADVVDDIRRGVRDGILSPPTVLDGEKNALQNERHAYTNWWNYNKGLGGKPAETEMDMIFAWYAHLKAIRQRLADARSVAEAIKRLLGASSGALLPNGTRIGGGVHTGPGGMGGVGGIGGAPSLPGYGGGLLGSLGGNRSGRGPGGSQFMPGLGFFPGVGPGPGGVGHGVGGIGLGGDEPPGPWNGGGLGSIGKHSGSGTGRQPGSSGSRKGSSPGYSETGSKGSGDRVTGADVDRNKVGTGGSPTPGPGDGTIVLPAPGPLTPSPPVGSPTPPSTPSGPAPSDPTPSDPTPSDPTPPDPDPDGEGMGDPWGDGGDEGPPIHKGGPYFTPHGGSTGGVGVIVAGGFGPRVPGSPVSYLDFLYKNVGPEGDGWGGNNPVVTPAIKPSDLFKPADDSIGPYNPKGTDYRPAPDDPTPGGPAGAAGRATRVRVG